MAIHHIWSYPPRSRSSLSLQVRSAPLDRLKVDEGTKNSTAGPMFALLFTAERTRFPLASPGGVGLFPDLEPVAVCCIRVIVDANAEVEGARGGVLDDDVWSAPGFDSDGRPESAVGGIGELAPGVSRKKPSGSLYCTARRWKRPP